MICLLDLQGNVVERYRYTAYGEAEILSLSGKQLTTSAVSNPYQYASKRLDPETGFIAFGLRYYDPSLGRWITPDPAGVLTGLIYTRTCIIIPGSTSISGACLPKILITLGILPYLITS